MSNRAGILTVTDELLREIGGVSRILPPAHHARAARLNEDLGVTDFLVEGPWLPIEVKPGAPEPIDIFFTVSRDPDRSNRAVTARFEHDSVRTWVVSL